MVKKKTKSVTLDEELLNWYDKQENSSKEIRNAIKIYIMLKKELNSNDIEFRTRKAIKYYKRIEKEFEENIGINLNDNTNYNKEKNKNKINKSEIRKENDILENKIDNL